MVTNHGFQVVVRQNLVASGSDVLVQLLKPCPDGVDLLLLVAPLPESDHVVNGEIEMAPLFSAVMQLGYLLQRVFVGDSGKADSEVVRPANVGVAVGIVVKQALVSGPDLVGPVALIAECNCDLLWTNEGRGWCGRSL